jgi:hypothetical protein
MKTSSTDLSRTEKFLRGELRTPDALVYEANLLIDEDMRKKTFYHRMVHSLVRAYHRKKLKAEVQDVHNQLFNDPAKAHVWREVIKLFKS